MENRACCAVQVNQFTRFCHACGSRPIIFLSHVCVASLGAQGSSGPRFIEPSEPPVYTPLERLTTCVDVLIGKNSFEQVSIHRQFAM